MIPLCLPQFDIKIVHREGRPVVFDFLRGRYVALTPEEWVRQHFTHYLVSHKHYPAALLANEVTLGVGRGRRRCDTVLYRREGATPRLIVEYKAPSVPISQQVFQQIYDYNALLRADYLVVSNGLVHYCCHVDYAQQSLHFLHAIPDYLELC